MSPVSMLSAGAAPIRQTLREQVLAISQSPPDRETFDALALAIFRYQAAYNPVYGEYVRHLNIRPDAVTELRRVPFMPIGFFKNHRILTGFNFTNPTPPGELTFVSSGTTTQDAGQNSRHIVPDPDLYNAVSTRIFEQTYDPLGNMDILALLPSYLERNNSSLVYMVQQFMNLTGSQHSGFFGQDYGELTARLRHLTTPAGPGQTARRILLIGVTFALLDWAESTPDLSFLGQHSNLIMMETGGMKGRRKELLREEVHHILTERTGTKAIHSEYGMTELLSQAYSTGHGVFRPGPTLRVFLRDINDPFLLYPTNFRRTGERRTGSRQTGERRTGERRTGGINVVDLANLDSCSFIETQDLGRYVGDEGSFEVIGRFDNSDVRGCNLMVL